MISLVFLVLWNIAAYWITAFIIFDPQWITVVADVEPMARFFMVMFWIIFNVFGGLIVDTICEDL